MTLVDYQSIDFGNIFGNIFGSIYKGHVATVQ